MANRSRAERVVLPPKRTGKLSKAAQKFALKKQIKEAKAKIEELNR